MIEFIDVTFGYGEKNIVDHFSKTFEDGKFYLIVGESGVGKTTLLKLAYGELKPTKGKIISDNLKASYIFDKDNLFNTSVLNNLKCVSDDISKIDELLLYFNLLEFKNTNVNDLSNGQKRRVSIIRSLLVDADAYFIDEAIRGLDEENVILVLNKFKEIFKNKTVLYITHNKGELKDLANEVIELE